MLFLQLAFVTSEVSAIILAVVVICLHLLFRSCFGLGAVHGLRGMCTFSAPPPNPAVKRDVALKRVAPYF